MTAELGERPGPSTARSPARRLRSLGAWAPAAAWRVDVITPPRKRASRTAFWVPTIVLLAVDLAAFWAAVLLTGTTSWKTLTVLALVLVFFHNAELYRSRLSLSILDDAPAILGRALAAGAAAMVLGGLEDGVAGTARLRTALVFGGLSLVGRELAYCGIRIARRHHRLRQNTLLLGCGTMAGSLAANLLAHPHYGLQPKGFL